MNSLLFLGYIYCFKFTTLPSISWSLFGTNQCHILYCKQTQSHQETIHNEHTFLCENDRMIVYKNVTRWCWWLWFYLGNIFYQSHLNCLHTLVSEIYRGKYITYTLVCLYLSKGIIMSKGLRERDALIWFQY